MTPQELSNMIYGFYTDDCRSYSGRYMYGKKCLGITCDNPMSLFVELIGYIQSEIEYDIKDVTIADGEFKDERFIHDSYFTVFQEVLDLLKDAKTDSMGMQSILYFPDIPPPEEF